MVARVAAHAVTLAPEDISKQEVGARQRHAIGDQHLDCQVSDSVAIIVGLDDPRRSVLNGSDFPRFC